VHISELAQHHVENPREVVSQGDPVNVLILEVDGERRRLSLSLKRVEEGQEPMPRADGAESVHLTPNLQLSEDAFPAQAEAATEDEPATEPAAADEAELDEAPAAEAAAPEPVAEVATEEPAAETEEEPAVEAEAAAEVEPVAAAADEPADDVADEAEPAASDDTDETSS
jgi:small subunit ribosomal protein S1